MAFFCQRTIDRTIESRDNGLISGWAYNRDFTVFIYDSLNKTFLYKILFKWIYSDEDK